VCNDYGVIVDAFIPYKKSKAERKPSSLSHPSNANERNSPGSYVSTLKSSKTNNVMSDHVLPSLILDDLCISDRDFSLSLMGKVKDITVMPNLYWVRAKEMEAWDLFICNDSYESESSDDEEDAKDNIKEGVIGLHPLSNRPIGWRLCDYGDFNEVRTEQERYGSVFNVQGTNAFNSFISLASLIDIPLDGYAYNWAHKTTNKMNHRLILMRELSIDYGFTPFRFFHSWFNLDGFDKIIEDTWKSLATVDSNGVINLKKLQALKIVIKQWTKNAKKSSYKAKTFIQSKLSDIDKILDQSGSNEEILSDRSLLLNELNYINSIDSLEAAQKSKVR
ncbi:hypothetical protein Tco_0982117, partial [Tanacetum coccineum]